MVIPGQPLDELLDKPLNPTAAKRVLQALADVGEIDQSLPKLDGYHLIRRLGKGGGGDVFQAVRIGSDHLVAVKLLHGSDLGESGQRRVWRELDMLASVRSRNLPRLFDYGIHFGRMFIVTEYIEGVGVHAYCEANDLPLRGRVELLSRISVAVQETLHERGILHRDLKPTNVLVDALGEPVIIDLGIAQLMQGDAVAIDPDVSVMAGTPGYMSPEQARGDRSAISTRSDVFGLGAIAYQILAGQAPHPIDLPTHELLRRIATEPPRSLPALNPSLPKALAAILTKATSFKPEDRYGTAGEFGADLRRWLSNEPLHAVRTSMIRQINLYRKRRPAAFVAITTGLIVLACLICAIGWGISQYRLRREAQAIVHDRTELTLERQKAFQTLRGIVAKYVDGTTISTDSGEIERTSRLIRGVSEMMKQTGITDEQLVAQLGASREDVALEILRFLYAREDMHTIEAELKKLRSSLPTADSN